MNDALTTRNEYVQRHRQRCRSVAARFVRQGLEQEDLEQIAVIGLIKAADRFNAAYGTSFWTFARTHVIGELMHYVRDHEALVRLPRTLQTMHRREQQSQCRLWIDLGREPSIAELADALGCSEYDVRDLHQARYRCNVADIDESLQAIPAERHVEERALLLSSLCRLEHDEQALLMGVYGLRLSQTEAGMRLGYTQRSASRLHKRALEKLSLALGEV